MTSTLHTQPCNCCTGIEARTPEALANRPGLSAIAYRAGTYGTFQQAMQVETRRQAALRDLAAPADDPTAALMDAWAVTLDVLTFYQERIANEHYLRTATERRSVLELAQQIGYELGPGVAAGTFLAFTLEAAAGAPLRATIPVGTRTQSVPGQDEKPQTFETVAEIHAEAAWNAMGARTDEAYTPGMQGTRLYLAGVATNLQPGDALLLIGEERTADAGSESWDFRRVQTVTPDRARNLTTIVLGRPLGSVMPWTRPAANPIVYALRTRAALFGHNAPDWKAMPDEIQGNYGGSDSDADWPGLTLTGIAGTHPANTTLFLDRLYKEIVPDSWVVVTTPDYAEVYRVESVAEDARTGFTLSARTTRLTVSGENLITRFDDDVRRAGVYGASEMLLQARRPITADVYGTSVLLAAPVPPLEKGRMVAVTGLDARAGEPQAEVAELLYADTVEDTTRLTFTRPLEHQYNRESVRFNANVAPATHGESRAETLGSGSGAASFQAFELKNEPLTYVSAPTPSGVESTLEVRVDGVRWDEVPTLYRQPAGAEVFTTRLADDGTTTVQFGDGKSGARLPTGVENVSAVYRAGLGMEGHVDAGQISLLLTRPLGVKSVVNPLPATGADDPEKLDEARQNAPLTVLTLDRVVSLRDVQHFARAFPGVGKAQAARLWSGETRFVFVTIAGEGGTAVPASSALYENLRDALQGAWHGAERIEIQSYDARTFGLGAGLVIDTRYKAADVLEQAHDALAVAFSFDARALAQGVTASEVMAVLQGVTGVVAVDLDRLGGSDVFAQPRLLARAARYSGGMVHPAELLTLDPTLVALHENVL